MGKRKREEQGEPTWDIKRLDSLIVRCDENTKQEPPRGGTTPRSSSKARIENRTLIPGDAAGVADGVAACLQDASRSNPAKGR